MRSADCTGARVRAKTSRKPFDVRFDLRKRTSRIAEQRWKKKIDASEVDETLRIKNTEKISVSLV